MVGRPGGRGEGRNALEGICKWWETWAAAGAAMERSRSPILPRLPLNSHHAEI